MLAIANAKLLKKYGYNALITPIIEGIQKIELGFSFIINGGENTVYGKVVSCSVTQKASMNGEDIWMV